MRSSHVLLLCILGAALLSSVICSNEAGPDNCCFTFYGRKLNKNKIRSYKVTDRRCTRSGIIFMTQKNNSICVDPTLSWVEGIMKNVDERTL